MRRIASGVLAIVVLLCTPLIAGVRALTVQQLGEMLASAHASRLSDAEIAAELGMVELTERLTEGTLATLWREQGGRTKFALWILADESASLDPPASELPSEAPPDLGDQKAILARAGGYAIAYISDLPNFTCTQLTRRFQDDPLEALFHPAGVAVRCIRATSSRRN